MDERKAAVLYKEFCIKINTIAEQDRWRLRELLNSHAAIYNTLSLFGGNGFNSTTAAERNMSGVFEAYKATTEALSAYSLSSHTYMQRLVDCMCLIRLFICNNSAATTTTTATVAATATQQRAEAQNLLQQIWSEFASHRAKAEAESVLHNLFCAYHELYGEQLPDYSLFVADSGASGSIGSTSSSNARSNSGSRSSIADSGSSGSVSRKGSATMVQLFDSPLRLARQIASRSTESVAAAGDYFDMQTHHVNPKALSEAFTEDSNTLCSKSVVSTSSSTSTHHSLMSSARESKGTPNKDRKQRQLRSKARRRRMAANTDANRRQRSQSITITGVAITTGLLAALGYGAVVYHRRAATGVIAAANDDVLLQQFNSLAARVSSAVASLTTRTMVTAYQYSSSVVTKVRESMVSLLSLATAAVASTSAASQRISTSRIVIPVAAIGALLALAVGYRSLRRNQSGNRDSDDGDSCDADVTDDEESSDDNASNDESIDSLSYSARQPVLRTNNRVSQQSRREREQRRRHRNNSEVSSSNSDFDSIIADYFNGDQHNRKQQMKAGRRASQQLDDDDEYDSSKLAAALKSRSKHRPESALRLTAHSNSSSISASAAASIAVQKSPSTSNALGIGSAVASASTASPSFDSNRYRQHNQLESLRFYFQNVVQIVREQRETMAQIEALLCSLNEFYIALQLDTTELSNLLIGSVNHSTSSLSPRILSTPPSTQTVGTPPASPLMPAEVSSLRSRMQILSSTAASSDVIHAQIVDHLSSTTMQNLEDTATSLLLLHRDLKLHFLS